MPGSALLSWQTLEGGRNAPGVEDKVSNWDIQKQVTICDLNPEKILTRFVSLIEQQTETEQNEI